MKTFISYKQTGVSETELKEELEYLQNIVENASHKAYVYLFDKDANNNFKSIIKKVNKQIGKSDLVICFINHSKKSEGQLIELGIARGLDKKVLLIINEKFRDDYFLIYGLDIDAIYFKKIEEVDGLLTNYLEGK